MRLLILGAGGVGGYFGGRLVQAGIDVTFLTREPRTQQLARDGLTIESCFGNIHTPINVLSQGEDIAPPDIIVLACKAHGLAGAMESFAPYVGEQTAILPLLNGIAHFEFIEQRLPKTPVWGGLAHIGVTLCPNGKIRHLNKIHEIRFGPRDGKYDVRARQLVTAFGQTPVDAQLKTNIVQDLWDKMVFLTTLAGSTCLMRANIGTILQTTYGDKLIFGLLDECIMIAHAEGFAPHPDQISHYRVQLSEPGSQSTASMLRDIEQGFTTEFDHILGDMISKARKHGIETPFLDIAFTNLQAYEARLSAQVGLPS